MRILIFANIWNQQRWEIKHVRDPIQRKYRKEEYETIKIKHLINTGSLGLYPNIQIPFHEMELLTLEKKKKK